MSKLKNWYRIKKFEHKYKVKWEYPYLELAKLAYRVKDKI